MQMNRRFYLIPRIRNFLRSFQFTFRLTILASLPGDRCEQRFDKREQKHTKNNTFEDKTRNNHQYTTPKMNRESIYHQFTPDDIF